MALRPVSELGLVEVTDVAPSAPPAEDQATTGARGAGIVASVLSGAIGVAGAVLVGRALLRR
jgi:hypothetical protein